MDHNISYPKPKWLIEEEKKKAEAASKGKVVEETTSFKFPVPIV